jgi:hypothetical protein
MMARPLTRTPGDRYNGASDYEQYLVPSEANGTTALQWAVYDDDLRTVKIFVTRQGRAALQTTDKLRSTALHTACFFGKVRERIDSSAGRYLQRADICRMCAVNVRLFPVCIHAHMRAHARSHGAQDEAAKLLFEGGASTAAKNFDGHTPLELALMNGSVVCPRPMRTRLAQLVRGQCMASVRPGWMCKSTCTQARPAGAEAWTGSEACQRTPGGMPNLPRCSADVQVVCAISAVATFFEPFLQHMHCLTPTRVPTVLVPTLYGRLWGSAAAC